MLMKGFDGEFYVFEWNHFQGQCQLQEQVQFCQAELVSASILFFELALEFVFLQRFFQPTKKFFLPN